MHVHVYTVTVIVILIRNYCCSLYSAKIVTCCQNLIYYMTMLFQVNVCVFSILNVTQKINIVIS